VVSPALQGVCAAVATACGVSPPQWTAGAVDWPELVRLIDRHRVAPLVQRSGWLAEAAAPADVRAAVQDRVRAGALASLRLLALQREVLEVLGAEGVDVVLLKGAVLALDAHGESTARAPGDLDVLVRPESVSPAIAALRSAGLRWYGSNAPDDADGAPVEPETLDLLPRLPMLRHAMLHRDGLSVEVHWRLFPNPRLMPVDPDWLAHPRHVAIQGADVPTLPLTSEWLYVLVHGSNHGWARMKWLADVPALAVRHPHRVEIDALEAVPPGYRRSVATGLLVAEAAFGGFLTPESRAWASRVRGTGILVRRSLAALRADTDPPRRVAPSAMPAVVRERLALRPDAAYRLEELRLLLLSAGRAQGIEEPGVLDLAAGPLRWARRTAKRLAGQDGPAAP
jgi:hypothetical protein